MSEALVFEPREYPSVNHDRDTLIVTTNHLGADMHADAGLDAQYIADVSGHRVVGLNRIGSGDGIEHSKTLARRITQSPEDITIEWHELLSTELRRQAPSRVELVGRSAGANLMLQVAALELIPETVGILAIEALRLQRVNTRLGQLKYACYQLMREGMFKTDVDEIVDADLRPGEDERPAEASNTKLMIKRQVQDIRHYQHLWASDLPLRNALTIAEKDKIAASFVFAKESMAADSGKLDEFLQIIRQARRQPAVNQVATEIAPCTTHGSFDDQRLYATYYRRFAKIV